MKSFSKIEPQGIPEVLQLRSYDFPPRYTDHETDWEIISRQIGAPRHD